MKYLVSLLMCLMCLSCSSKSQSSATSQADASSEQRVLVAYFSCTGTTEAVAKTIASAVDGKLYQITPAEPYTDADLDWTDKSSRSTVEMASAESRPAIAGEQVNIADYDVVFIGFPIWWDLAPREINTFLEKYDFSNVKVIPFATSGGSTIANSEKQLQATYPNLNWLPGKLLNGSRADITSWSQQVVNDK